MASLELYKRGQGKYTRSVTFISAVVLGVIGAYALSDKLELYVGGLTFGTYLRFGIPTVLVVLLGLLMFWVVNRPRSADFLIATEGEMKKVSWSSKKEIVGSTKVVIVTTFMLAAILFSVDILFQVLFQWMGIMGV